DRAGEAAVCGPLACHCRSGADPESVPGHARTIRATFYLVRRCPTHRWISSPHLTRSAVRTPYASGATSPTPTHSRSARLCGRSSATACDQREASHMRLRREKTTRRLMHGSAAFACCTSTGARRARRSQQSPASLLATPETTRRARVCARLSDG